MPIIRFTCPRARDARIRKSGLRWRMRWPRGSSRWRTCRGANERAASALSERDVRAALEREDPPRVVGRGDLEPQPFDDLPHGADLRSIGFGKFACPEPKAVLEAHADIAA